MAAVHDNIMAVTPERKDMGAVIFDLDVARQRRYYISLAHGDFTWHQIKASFAISGIDLDDSVAEMIGRKIAGSESFESATITPAADGDGSQPPCGSAGDKAS